MLQPLCEHHLVVALRSLGQIPLFVAGHSLAESARQSLRDLSPSHRLADRHATHGLRRPRPFHALLLEHRREGFLTLDLLKVRAIVEAWTLKADVADGVRHRATFEIRLAEDPLRIAHSMQSRT